MNRTTTDNISKSSVGGITMKRETIISQVATKVAEMEELLNELLNKEGLAESTKRTQKFQRESAIHTLKVLMAIAQADGDEVKFTMDQEKWYKSMTTLTATRKAASTIEAKEGDNVFAIMQKYPNKNLGQIEKALSKMGLKLQGQTVIKA